MRADPPASDGLRFRRERRTPGPGRWLAMLALLLVVGGIIAARAWWTSTPPPGVLVEVQGDVPEPGWHRIDPATLRAAAQAAGATGTYSRAPLHEGDLVRITAAGVSISPAGNPLLVALPVDVNEAGPEALSAVPGIGEALATAIIEERAVGGPFYDLGDLVRVRGMGGSTVETLAPLLTVGDVGPRPPPRPVDLNTATAAQLERLPGIGAVTAARIVVDRDENGPYRALGDLTRVSGIGEATAAGLEGHAVAVAP